MLTESENKPELHLGNQVFRLAQGIRNWWVDELENWRIIFGSRVLGWRIYQKRKVGIITKEEYFRRIDAADRFGYDSTEVWMIAHNFLIEDEMRKAQRPTSLAD